jgi:hypothetical protein
VVALKVLPIAAKHQTQIFTDVYEFGGFALSPSNAPLGGYACSLCDIYSVHCGRVGGMGLVASASMGGGRGRNTGSLRNRLLKGGDPAVALRLSEENLAGQLRLFGTNGSPTATARREVAKDLEAMGRFEEARPLREQVADPYRRQFGDEHPFTLTSEEWLAVNLNHSGIFMEARTLLIHASRFDDGPWAKRTKRPSKQAGGLRL